MSDQHRLFLDSGAFSLYALAKKDVLATGGNPNDPKQLYKWFVDGKGPSKQFKDYLDRYAAFVKKHIDVLDVYASVDVILHPQLTWKSQQYLEKKHGLSPLPCIHFGSDLKWIHHYLDRGYEYIAFGGSASIRTTTQTYIQWADRAWDVVCDSPGRLPRAKVHGFAMTSVPIMFRYPWFSVDSTSWTVHARNGSILMPRWANGKYIYNSRTWKIGVSDRSPEISREDSLHYSVLPANARAVVDRYIAEHGYVLGKSTYRNVPADYKPKEGTNERLVRGKNKDGTKTLEIVEQLGLSNEYMMRDEMNIIYFTELEKHFPKWPWAWKSPRRLSIPAFDL